MLKRLFINFKNHWNVPKEGESLSYKEIALHGLGGNGVSLISGMYYSYAATAVNCLLTATVYGILPMDIWLIGVVSAIVGLLRAPIVGWVIDNTQTKYGKFKPLLFAFSIPSAIILVLMAIIPAQFMGAANYNSRLISIMILSGLLSFFLPAMSICYNGLTQVMTMNSNERNKFYSILSIVQNLFPSLMQIILPPVAILIAPKLGMEAVIVYQITFPILGFIGIVSTLGSVFGAKERTIISSAEKVKVKMRMGMVRCLKNREFVLLTSSFILGGLRASFNIMYWICIYQMAQPLGTNVLGVAAAICGFGNVPGMALAPLIANKLGKKNALLLIHAMGLLTVLPMLIFLGQPFVLLAIIFVQNIISGAFIVMETMKADILDYEQYKSGERLEGFFNNFQTSVIALFGIATSLVTPLILEKFCGINKNLVGEELENAYTVLRQTDVRNKVFTTMILIAAGSYILGAIPIIFYRLSDKKHKEIIEILKERAKINNSESFEKEEIQA